MQQQSTTTRYAGRIVTVDPTQGLVQVMLKTQQVSINMFEYPVAFRWPVVGEGWWVTQKNGSWYLDGYYANDQSTFQSIEAGDVILTSPTGTVQVVTDGGSGTPFSLQATNVVSDPISGTAAIGTPPGADVANNNLLSAPSQMALLNPGVAGSGYNAVTGSVSYDPNGWISGTIFTVPKGVYKLEYTYQINYISTPAVNVHPAVLINGTGVQLANGISTDGLNSYQTFSGVQLLTASTAPTTFEPAVYNESTPNASAQVVQGIWIITRVN